MPRKLIKPHVEEAALTWFGELGYSIGHGPHMAPGELEAERDSFDDVVLMDRLRDAITRLNPTVPIEAREEALRKVLRKVLRQDNPSFLTIIYAPYPWLCYFPSTGISNNLVQSTT